jgi:hypothetical protein
VLCTIFVGTLVRSMYRQTGCALPAMPYLCGLSDAAISRDPRGERRGQPTADTDEHAVTPTRDADCLAFCQVAQALIDDPVDA